MTTVHTSNLVAARNPLPRSLHGAELDAYQRVKRDRVARTVITSIASSSVSTPLRSSMLTSRRASMPANERSVH